MNFIILTGMSGSGKSKAMASLEDIGFFCVDNIPPTLLEKFAELAEMGKIGDKGMAVVVDIRSKDMFSSFESELDKLGDENVNFKLVYIDADNEIILNRYKETRRRHPLAEDGLTLEKCIEYEREQLDKIKKRADFFIDTTNLSPAQLKEKIIGFFGSEQESPITINCVSFGFKYGTPSDVDLQYDVRCLANPFYVPALKHKTGLSKDVSDYVMADPNSLIYRDKVKEFIDFVMPLYIKEGKSQLTIGFGCTGGKHRSVTFAELTGNYLTSKGYATVITHRDIEKK